MAISGQDLPLEMLESAPKLAAQLERLLFPKPAVQMSAFGKSDRLLTATSSHSLVLYNILGVVSHCGVRLDETML